MCHGPQGACAPAVDLASAARYNLAVPFRLAGQWRVALVVGVGIEVIDLEEFRGGLCEELVRELYLPDEIRYARTQARSWESLGARLAAKRAVFKALAGHGAVEPAWHDVEVVRHESGELDVRLSGRALALSVERGASDCRLSMSHTRTTALAVVLLEGEGRADDARDGTSR